jgi:hypothetical protein
MKNLEIDYPNGPTGIDFTPILASTPNHPTHHETGRVISASGRLLDFQVGQAYLHLKDTEKANSGYFMEAFLDRHGVLRFSLTTRRQPGVPNQQFAVHPDFYAGKFAGVALQHFGTFRAIEAITSEWCKKSVSFPRFMDTFERTGDKITAAQNTWAWETYSKYGFTDITKVQLDIDTDWPPFIEATFKNPERRS